MRDRADTLRRRIEYYRDRLSEGLDASLARQYLEQIAMDERELAALETELAPRAHRPF